MYDRLAVAGYCLTRASTGLEKIWLSQQKNKVTIFYYSFSTQYGKMNSVRGFNAFSKGSDAATIKSIAALATSQLRVQIRLPLGN